ncbi:glycosyl hydrolase [Streptomyces sp. NPDC059010]|uniref:glycosyl hydrolase n=1 Tax=Streptomyces sp. NPDC059010 TaxID=3346695 RepID=UPI0036CBBB93
MRFNKKIAATVSALAMTTGLLAMSGAATTASAADGCSTNVVTGTARSATGSKGQLFELRYNGSGNNTCAWGRVTNGAPGMHVWVDRSRDGGRTWEPQLGWREIAGGTSVHTEAWRDPNGSVMRACGDSGYNTVITCTGWF